MGDSSLGIVVLRTNLLVLRSKHMGADGYEPKGDELSSRQKKKGGWTIPDTVSLVPSV